MDIEGLPIVCGPVCINNGHLERAVLVDRRVNEARLDRPVDGWTGYCSAGDRLDQDTSRHWDGFDDLPRVRFAVKSGVKLRGREGAMMGWGAGAADTGAGSSAMASSEREGGQESTPFSYFRAQLLSRRI